jgi:hypothetical protein
MSSFILTNLVFVESNDCLDILKALADLTRQRIVKKLLTGDLGVNELADSLQITQYNTSKHLRVLKEAGIVDVRAIAQKREYFIATTFRRRLEQEGTILDFGCCSFRMDRLAE